MNETDLEAALRELEEETGIILEETKYSTIVKENYTYDHPNGFRVHKTNHYFVINLKNCIKPRPDGVEVIEAKWVKNVDEYIRNKELTEALKAHIKGEKR